MSRYDREQYVDDLLAELDVVKAERDRLAAIVERWSLEMRTALKPCGQCDFVESDGSLYCHCEDCQFRVTSKAWELFSIHEAAEAAKTKDQR